MQSADLYAHQHLSAYSAAVRTIGTSEFAPSLMEGLAHFVQISHCTIIDVQGAHARSAGIASRRSTREASALTEAYVNGYFLQDPMVLGARCRSLTVRALPVIRSLELERATPGYRARFFVDSCIVDKISVVQYDTDSIRFLNLYKTNDLGRFDDQERKLIASSADFFSAMLDAHVRVQLLNRATMARESLRRAWEEDLSDRERAVALALGRGSSVKEVACRLLLSPTTVITYKRRAFSKLGVATQRDLVGVVAQIDPA